MIIIYKLSIVVGAIIGYVGVIFLGKNIFCDEKDRIVKNIIIPTITVAVAILMIVYGSKFLDASNLN
jgi:hypothetical protein